MNICNHCWHETTRRKEENKHGPFAPSDLLKSYSEMKVIKICCNCGEERDSEPLRPMFMVNP